MAPFPADPSLPELPTPPGRAAEPTEAIELTPLCDEPEFAALVADLVADEAPRLFAVVQEEVPRIDGRIAAYQPPTSRSSEGTTVAGAGIAAISAATS